MYESAHWATSSLISVFFPDRRGGSNGHNPSKSAIRTTLLCGNPFSTGLAASTSRPCLCNCQLGGGHAQGCRPGEGSPSQATILQSLSWRFGAGFPWLLPDTTPRRTATDISGKSLQAFIEHRRTNNVMFNVAHSL